MISSFASTALTGIVPPLSAFPKIRISGFTFSWSQQSILPVLARPVCISSAINNTRASSQYFFASDKYPSSGTSTPASPWIGSTRKPATFLSFKASTKAGKSL